MCTDLDTEWGVWLLVCEQKHNFYVKESGEIFNLVCVLLSFQPGQTLKPGKSTFPLIPCFYATLDSQRIGKQLKTGCSGDNSQLSLTMGLCARPPNTKLKLTQHFPGFIPLLSALKMLYMHIEFRRGCHVCYFGPEPTLASADVRVLNWPSMTTFLHFPSPAPKKVFARSNHRTSATTLQPWSHIPRPERNE